MLLFIVIGDWIIGYALLFAAIKGDKATINGTPLWKKPWLPFVAAIAGGSKVSAKTSADVQEGFSPPPVTGGGEQTGGGDTQQPAPTSPHLTLVSALRKLAAALTGSSALLEAV